MQPVNEAETGPIVPQEKGPSNVKKNPEKGSWNSLSQLENLNELGENNDLSPEINMEIKRRVGGKNHSLDEQVADEYNVAMWMNVFTICQVVTFLLIPGQKFILLLRLCRQEILSL